MSAPPNGGYGNPCSRPWTRPSLTCGSMRHLRAFRRHHLPHLRIGQALGADGMQPGEIAVLWVVRSIPSDSAEVPDGAPAEVAGDGLFRGHFPPPEGRKRAMVTALDLIRDLVTMSPSRNLLVFKEFYLLDFRAFRDGDKGCVIACHLVGGRVEHDAVPLLLPADHPEFRCPGGGSHRSSG